MAKVRFRYGTKAEYDALSEKDPNSLYFISDQHSIYKGDELFASGIMPNLEYPDDAITKIDGGGAPIQEGGEEST